MTNIILHGCNGKMGQVITNLAQEDTALQIVAGVDQQDNQNNPYPFFSNLKTCNIAADVVIDFSSAQAVNSLLDSCLEKRIPLVLCSTGLSDIQIEKVKQAAEQIPILRSANMSLGINALMKLVQIAARILAEAGFDIEVIEKHHNQKLDAPSGTALYLADSINEVMHQKYHYEYDRTQRREKREKKEIGISSVRGGSIVGEHDVIFAGLDEVIELRHTAYSKAIFGKGALEAAKFLSTQKAGLYNMNDVIH